MKLSVNNQGDGFKLSSAILVYANNRSGYAQAAMATIQPVYMDDGRPVIGAGRPMTNKDYTELVKSLAPKERDALRWLDRRVLAKGAGRMLWWTPPQSRAMFFSTSNMAGDSVEGNAVCPNPGLVFLAVDRTLYVYAFRGKDEPTRDTPLAQAPFFNVWARGEVCQGNAPVPKEEHRDDPSAWERFFFGSRFTHPNFAQKDRLVKGISPVAFWRQQVNKPSKRFPESRLVDINIKVADLLDKDFVSKAQSITATGEIG